MHVTQYCTVCNSIICKLCYQHFDVHFLHFCWKIASLSLIRQFLLCLQPVTNLLRILESPLCPNDLMNPPLFLQGQNGHRQDIPDLCVNASSPQKDKT